jgi:HAE1 family hydrophobic/amphiphilic exporter-1
VRIADASIRRPVFAVMLVGGLVALGLVSLGRVGVDLFPRIEFPYVAVTTVLEGAAPETIESEVTDVLEEQLNTISGIHELRSVSLEGVSQVFLQFELEEDPEAKAQDVRDKVALARRDLPLDAEPPIVEKLDPAAAPILSVMLAGELPMRELTRFSEDVVKERLERIPGVGSVTRVGGTQREIRLWVDADRLRSYALGVDDLIRAVRSEHVDLPGGRLEAAGGRSELAVKTLGEVTRVPEFGEIAVAFRDGEPTRLRDVARVEDGVEDARSWAELDGTPGVALEVRRQSGRNSVEVAHAVKAAVEALRSEAPAGVQMIVARDVSRFIEASARDVALDMLLGSLLAVAITWVFLRSLRSTLITAVAIPASVIATFFFFYIMGFTFNVVTLMGLSVAIGILIDDAIVVLESAQREVEAGVPAKQAASVGTQRVFLAVVAGTASVLAVFLPIAFMRGMIGRMFYEYGLAISFSVAVSLLIAVTLTPMLCARVLRRESSGGPIARRLEAAYLRLERGYSRALAVALRRRGFVLAVALGSVVIGVLLARGLPMEFAGAVDRSEFEAVAELPLGAGIEQTKQVGARLTRALRSVPHVRSIFLTIGSDSAQSVNQARLYVELDPKRTRSVSQFELMRLAREAMLTAAPEAKSLAVSEIPWISGGGFTAYNLEYAFLGSDLRRLGELADQVAAQMRASPFFADTKSSYEPGKPELQILVDRRRAADLGVSVRSLATTVRALIGGVNVATFQDAGKRYDVRVRLEEGQRNDVAALERIQVRAEDGRLVDLANLAGFRIETGPARVERRNRTRMVSIAANTPPGVALGRSADALDAIVAEVGLGPGVAGKHQGQAERMKDSAASVGFAFGLALLALYMILASQFDSYLQPLVIMVSAPLSFVGAFAALALWRLPMSIFAQIGFVALMGIVMKNGILLVEYANERRAHGASAREAMLEAGPVRLRPVLMTALATVMGMVPIVLSESDAVEFRSPMAVLLIGGLLSSTFLTLLAVPVLYTLVEELRAAPARALARLRQRRVRSRQTTSPATSSAPSTTSSQR